MLHYRWWVPDVQARSRKPALVRLFTDLEYVSPWPYALLPALMLLCAAISPSMQTLPALMAATLVSAAWVVATRARFALALNQRARRNPHLQLVPRSDHRKAA